MTRDEAATDPLNGWDPDPLHPPDPSDCPKCGEWRDAPAADCVNCGYDPEPRMPYHGWSEPPRQTRIGHYARIAVVALVAAVVVLVGLALR